MAIRHLLEPVLDAGPVRATNFFNGRRLMAEDLTTEQAARRDQEAQLGQAIGEGVVRGLFVRRTAAGPRRLAIDRGLAINRDGETLRLKSPVELALEVDPEAAARGLGAFADCLTPSGPTIVETGLHLLTLRPVFGFEGRVETFGLETGRVLGCGQRDRLEGVSFRLLRLERTLFGADPTLDADLSPTDLAARSRLRSRLAARCLGIEAPVELEGGLTQRLRAGLRIDDFGVLGALRASGTLASDEVPLALLRLAAAGIDFVDTWSVRRLPQPVLDQADWPIVLASGQHRRRQAFQLQFQEQIRWLADEAGSDGLQSLRIEQCFSALPPAGVVPLPGTVPTEATEPFFENAAPGRPVFLAEGSWRRLLDLALSFEAVVGRSSSLRLFLSEVNVVTGAQGQSERWVLFASEALACAASIPVRQFIGGGQAAATPAILEQTLTRTARLYAGLGLLLKIRAGREFVGALALAQACDRCACLADAIASGARAECGYHVGRAVGDLRALVAHQIDALRSTVERTVKLDQGALPQAPTVDRVWASLDRIVGGTGQPPVGTILKILDAGLEPAGDTSSPPLERDDAAIASFGQQEVNDLLDGWLQPMLGSL